jgi:predicted outer membrane protein
MKKLLFAFLATAFMSSVSAQSVSEKTGVNSALGIAPKTEDFIKEAATSDMLEIAAAKIAQEKGNADEKKFAEQMVTDHTKTSADLKELVPTDMQFRRRLTIARRRSSTNSATVNRMTSQANTIPCRSALTKTQCPCSSATPRAVTMIG